MILPIKKQWFDMICLKVKREEYREIKPYYTKRFQTLGFLDKDGVPTQEQCRIQLRNGYSAASPTIAVDCSLVIGTGNPDWGAVPNVKYYVLQIREVWKK